MTEDGNGLWAKIQRKLDEAGLDIELPDLSGLDPANCRMICMPIGLSEALSEMEQKPRDRVVMVRLDDESTKSLDAWVETGAVKSRSGAAALFIREGLKVRAQELRELEEALRDVEEAKERLRRKARSVLRDDADQDDDGDAAQDKG
jgi:hypothetical protein